MESVPSRGSTLVFSMPVVTEARLIAPRQMAELV
jgi:hypothetical protein